MRAVVVFAVLALTAGASYGQIITSQPVTAPAITYNAQGQPVPIGAGTGIKAEGTWSLPQGQSVDYITVELGTITNGVFTGQGGNFKKRLAGGNGTYAYQFPTALAAGTYAVEVIGSGSTVGMRCSGG